MQKPINVSALNSQIKALLEATFLQVYVEGEISNLTYHNSGHIYFSIKDGSSAISCVMFKGNTRNLKFKLEVGLKIEIKGNITVYSPRGSYQLLCNKIEPAGQGGLALAFEQLKNKLKLKGYFDQEIKKQLPKFPKKIALVTSPTGAAIEDMKKVANNRWNMVEFILVPCLVQGQNAAFDISKSINFADKLNCDLIIVGRGGGSIEDLWAFNEEIVADSIYKTKTPVISAVGHEVDYLISDYVADVRAATPSNAMEIALPDSNEIRMFLDGMENDFNMNMKNIFYKKNQELFNLKKLFMQNSLEAKMNFTQKEIDYLKSSFEDQIKSIINLNQNKLDYLKSNFNINKPSKKDKKGFVQIVKNNKIISMDEININDEINLETSQYIADCLVKNIKKIK